MSKEYLEKHIAELERDIKYLRAQVFGSVIVDDPIRNLVMKANMQQYKKLTALLAQKKAQEVRPIFIGGCI